MATVNLKQMDAQELQDAILSAVRTCLAAGKTFSAYEVTQAVRRTYAGCDVPHNASGVHSLVRAEIAAQGVGNAWTEGIGSNAIATYRTYEPVLAASQAEPAQPAQNAVKPVGTLDAQKLPALTPEINWGS